MRTAARSARVTPKPERVAVAAVAQGDHPGLHQHPGQVGLAGLAAPANWDTEAGKAPLDVAVAAFAAANLAEAPPVQAGAVRQDEDDAGSRPTEGRHLPTGQRVLSNPPSRRRRQLCVSCDQRWQALVVSATSPASSSGSWRAGVAARRPLTWVGAASAAVPIGRRTRVKRANPLPSIESTPRALNHWIRRRC